MFKRLYRRTKVGNLRAIAGVVNQSAQCNFAQLVSSKDGSTIVQTHDWTDFFATRMKKITGIKKFHHFRVSSSSPGSVFVRELSDSPEVEISLLKEPWTTDPEELPAVIPPRGLSTERQWYLYEQIRPFCPDDDKDYVCPLPLVPRPGGSRRGTPSPDDGTTPPAPKRKRTCGVCKQEGHDRRSCPNN